MAKKNKVSETKSSMSSETTNNVVLSAKRGELIKLLSSKLLTKRQLKEGGSGIKSKANQEKCYQAMLDEINDLGKQIGEPKIGFGNIRRN